MPEASERSAFEVAERGGFIVPMPLVSRGRPRFELEAGAAPVDAASPWVAIHAGVGPARLLVIVGAPGARGSAALDYRVETSADSKGGSDGSFRFECRVSHARSAGHARCIEFDAQSWVRIVFEAGAADLDLPRLRLDLHDASDGTDDAWLVVGDALAGASFGLGALEPSGSSGPSAPRAPSVAELVHERYPGYFPAAVDETREDETPVLTLQRVAELVRSHADARRVALAYSGASLAGPLDQRRALEELVEVLVAAGRSPVIARTPPAPEVPEAAVVAFNQTIAELELRHRLVRGPALGLGAPQQLWLEALDVLYVPQ